jgi:murein DD-endopeptidase MepM/ murein hydrolase activator NlpD
VSVVGKLFFDVNASGIQDKATFTYDPVRLADKRQPLQPDLSRAIGDYVKAHPTLKKGDLVTIDEPSLAGYRVCAGDRCASTDGRGMFTINNVSEVSSVSSLLVVDPNKGKPALEMRYSSRRNGLTTAPAYTTRVDAARMAKLTRLPACSSPGSAQVCRQDGQSILVREQRLSDVDTGPMDTGIPISPLGSNEIGLMQGFLTLPYRSQDAALVSALFGMDHDGRVGRVVSYDGATLLTRIDPSRPATMKGPGTEDGHVGWDYGLPIGTVLVAVCDGAFETLNDTGGNGSKNAGIRTGSPSKPGGHQTMAVYGHLHTTLSGNGQGVRRGAVVAVSGMSGTGWAHLHFDLLWGSANPVEPDDYIKGGYQKDPYGVLEPVKVTDSRERYSSWTAFNLPVFAS